MKSHGILSRYMRPGFKEGGDPSWWDKTKEFVKNIKDADTSMVQSDSLYDLAEEAQKEKSKTTEEWRKEKYKYFRSFNVGLFERKRDAGEDRAGFDDDVTNSGFTNIDPTLFDEEKIRDGTQMIFNLDADGRAIQDGSGFLGSQGFEDIPFMFYESQDDLDYWLDKTDYDDMFVGKPYKDDISFFDKRKEQAKMLGRGALGFAKNLPEMAIGAYRYINPFDALGGIGPLDTWDPKDEAQAKQVDEMYEFPGYSQMMREKFGVEPFQTPKGVFGGILDADESLYKKTLFDDEAYANLSEKANLRNDYAGKDDAYIINDLQIKYPNAPLEAIQEYLDMDVRPVLDMSEKDFEDAIYWSDRDALSHDIPGAVGSILGTLPVMAGPLGAVGQGANLLSKGNKLSKMISKIRKPAKVKALDASIGIGVPQATGEYAVRKLQEGFGPSSVSFSEDEDSIYP
jgi:hypothetical protein